MTINIQTLFADMLPDPLTEQKAEGVRLSNLIQQGGNVAAYYQPQREAALRTSAGGLFGIDTTTEAERVRESLKGLKAETPQDLINLANLTENLSPEKALGLRTAAAQLTRTENSRTSMKNMLNGIEGINPNMKNAALQAIDAGSYDGNTEGLLEAVTPDPDRWEVEDGSVWDNFKGEWKVSPTQNGGIELSTLDPDLWTPESLVDYRTAIANATTDQERIDAGLHLKRIPEDGWNYVPVKDAEGNPVVSEKGISKMILKPTGAKLAAISKEVRAANRAGRTMLDLTGDVLETIGRVETALEGSEEEEGLSTGFAGAVLSYIPETKQYTLRGDLSTVLANLGYGALQAARNASSNGSSGFGQLTERELKDLKSLVDSLELGMNKEDFIERFNSVKRSFIRARKRAKTDWNVDTWIGVELPPKGIGVEGENEGDNVIIAPNNQRLIVTPSGQG